MGANAQTSVPTFTAGEVLTAANMNISARTGVPVFSNTTTRDAGFGGAGEKTLAEGQLCYLEDSNVVQYYDGAAWATVGPQTFTSGLTVVKAETSFTSATSFTADNVFTSSYTDYLLVVTTTSTAALTLQFRAGGSTTTSNYNRQALIATGTTVSAERFTSQSSLQIGDDTNTVIASIACWIYGPQLARQTNVVSTGLRNGSAATTPYIQLFYGNQSGSTQFDGIILNGGTNSMTGIYTIYALAKS